MIPVGDDNPSRRVPVVNWSLIAINIFVFLYELTLRPRALDRLFATWGVMPNEVWYLFAHPLNTPLDVWLSLFTSQFLHGGWAHIIGNMLFLWVFGDNIEDALGHFTYLAFYLASGVAAAFAQAFVSGASNIPSIGASGAIAGVLGAYLLMYPFSRIRILIPLFILFWTIQLPALIVIGWWFVQQFFYGVGSLGEAGMGGIAFWAHIGGFVAGIVLILPFLGRARQRRRVPRYYSSYDEANWG
ncbi:MAG: rhomboid family intramembrane serine protease [Chloroflexi bacterium]|nr:rhomboid family intramembrane serine protease [Chloroflexota bacterium]